MNLSDSKSPGTGSVLGGTGVPCGSKPLVWLSKAAGASVGDWLRTTRVWTSAEAKAAAKRATTNSLRTFIVYSSARFHFREGKWEGGCVRGVWSENKTPRAAAR